MADAEIKIEGLETVTMNLRQFAGFTLKELARAMNEVGELIATDSMQHTPVDFGTLRDSHIVETKEPLAGPITSVRAGGPAIPYAIAVHEHLSKSSPRSWKTAEKQGNPVQFSPPGTGPKFLENALRAKQPIEKTIGARLNLNRA